MPLYKSAQLVARSAEAVGGTVADGHRVVKGDPRPIKLRGGFE